MGRDHVAVAVRGDDIVRGEVEQGGAISEPARRAGLVEEADEAFLRIVVERSARRAQPRPVHDRHERRDLDLAGQPLDLQRPLPAGQASARQPLGDLLLRADPALDPRLAGRRGRPRLARQRDEQEG